ncbi:MAG TPA: High-affinity nickel-transporter [Actinomycetota bacterium]|nr:High-affinity nickel-transporter [Actinomycetota bacterium]
MSARRRLGVVLIAIAVPLLAPAVAAAHPLGNFTVNTYEGLQIGSGRIHVDLVVDMAEIPTFQELPAIDANGDGVASSSELEAYAAAEAPRLLRGLDLRVDGSPVRLSALERSATLRPGQGGLHCLRVEVLFGGRIPDRGAITFSNDDFADRIGWREITAVGVDGGHVVRSSVPPRSVSDRLLAYPTDLLQSPLRVTSATVRYRPGAATTLSPAADGGTSSARPGVADGRFAGLVSRHGAWLIAIALALASALGALHALGPGHGKTLMAAYLVSADGRLRHAVSVGVAVAAMHTASVLSLGLLVFSAERLFPIERVYGWLGLLSGVLAIAIGAGLLRTRLRGRTGSPQGHDHVHPHHHEHGGEGEPYPDHSGHARRPLSKRGLIALAFAGGILPSPSALIVLLGSISIGRVGFGLALIAAFSVGMAASLVGAGVLALRARAFVERRSAGRLARLLPIGSAAGIVLVGALLAARGLAQL